MVISSLSGYTGCLDSIHTLTHAPATQPSGRPTSAPAAGVDDRLKPRAPIMPQNEPAGGSQMYRPPSHRRSLWLRSWEDVTGRKTAVEDFPTTAVHLKRCSFPAQRCCTSIQHTYIPLSPSGVDKQTAHRHVPVYRVRHTDSKRTTLDISPPVCAAMYRSRRVVQEKNICCLYFQNIKTFFGETLRQHHPRDWQQIRRAVCLHAG